MDRELVPLFQINVQSIVSLFDILTGYPFLPDLLTLLLALPPEFCQRMVVWSLAMAATALPFSTSASASPMFFPCSSAIKLNHGFNHQLSEDNDNGC